MNNSTNSNGNGSKKSKFSNIFTLVSSLLIAGTIACSQPGVSIDKIIPKKPEVKAEVVEKKEEEIKPTRNDTKYSGKKIGRNEPCFCGSGKKYKHCCGAL